MQRQETSGLPSAPSQPPPRSLILVAPLKRDHAPLTQFLPQVLPQAAGAPLCNPRPSAVFVAHLIATAQRFPQTRARGRAEAKYATAVYATAALSEPLHALKRSM